MVSLRRPIGKRLGLIASAAIAVLAVPATLPAIAVDQYTYPSDDYITGSSESDFAAGWRKISIYEMGGPASISTTFAYRVFNGQEEWQLCGTHDSGFCAPGSGYDVVGYSVLPICANDAERNCIEGLSVGSTDGMYSAALDRQITGVTYPGNAAHGVPVGSSISVWRVPQFPHSGGDEYSVAAGVRWRITNGVFSANDLEIKVYGTTERFDENSHTAVPMAGLIEDGDGTTRYTSGANTGYGQCVYTQRRLCARDQELADGTRIKLALRVTNGISGWLFGRLKNPRVDISSLDSTHNRLEIEADPVTVPMLQGNWNQNEIPGLVHPTRTGNFGGGSFMAISSDRNTFRYLSALRGVTNDRASGLRTIWAVQSTIWNTQAASRCSQAGDGLLGMVTTNSMAYQGGVPDFRDGYFSYEVAGLHYAPDGQTVNLGTYDLVMRSDVARCLYGFSRAPVSATVSVIGDQGEEKIATTIVSERDGWLKLAAYGFTFSEKQIQVQLRQSQQRTLTNFTANSTRLTNQQRAEIRAVMARSAGNGKFICTGIRFINQPVSENIRVRARAKAACDYAKSLNPKLSYWFQTKTTTARNFNGRVIVVSKN